MAVMTVAWNLKIDKKSFDCSDLGPNSVVLMVTDPATDLTDECTATITVVDRTAPAIACPGSKILSPDQNGDYIMPDYTFGIISDNCDDVSALTITQYPAEGTPVTADTTVEITAEDSFWKHFRNLQFHSAAGSTANSTRSSLP